MTSDAAPAQMPAYILRPLAPFEGASRPGYYYFTRKLALDDMADVFEVCQGGGTRTVGVTWDGLTIDFDDLFKEQALAQSDGAGEELEENG